MKKKELLTFIENFKPVKVLVFGDFMLDHYIWGKVDRISPEAPIPIVQAQEEKFHLGGAGCCLSNLLTLNCPVTPIGIYGKDASGEKLLNILKEKNIDSSKFFCVKDYQTVTKCRILTKRQQILRVDYEKRFILDQKTANQFLGNLDFLEDFQVLVISDYLKGSCSAELVSKLIQEAKKRGVFVIVDPAKGINFSIYKGANCIKPNRLESETFCQGKFNYDYLKAAAFIQKQTLIDTIVISLDKEGLLIYRNPKEYQIFPTTQESVFDVTGAGDLVTTMIAVTLGNKNSMEIAGRLANLAAGVAIKKLGTYSPSWNEIKAELRP